MTAANDKPRGRRSLGEDESALWQGVTRSVVPLRRRLRTPATADKDLPGEKLAAERSTPAPSKKITVRPEPAPKAAPPLAPLGRRLKQRVARGTEPIDARIDLHGSTQSEAHHALLRFLRKAQADGAKTVLVITGKGERGSETSWGQGERGVLKRQVPQWLRLPEFRTYVVGFEDAHAAHGGQGALYVRVRKAGR